MCNLHSENGVMERTTKLLFLLLILARFSLVSEAQTTAPIAVEDPLSRFGSSQGIVPLNLANKCAPRYIKTHDGGEIISGRCCCYPSLSPCQDKDKDSEFVCPPNETTRLYGVEEVGNNLTLSKRIPEYESAEKPWLIILSSCSDFPHGNKLKPTPFSDCNIGWYNQLDCDDTLSTILRRGDGRNTGPLAAVVYLNRDVGAAKRESEARKIKPLVSAFHPMESLIVGVKAHSCAERVFADVSVSVGGGELVSVGRLDFKPKADPNRELDLDNWGVPNSAQFRAPDMWYGRMASVFSVTGEDPGGVKLEAILKGVQRAKHQQGASSSGPVPAKLVVTTPHGSQSIEFALDPCVPIFGSGPFSIAFGRADSFRKIDPQRWILRPVDSAKAFEPSVLNMGPFKSNRNLFSVFADLSILSESLDTRKLDDENFTSTFSGAPACSAAYPVFESGLIGRSYAEGAGSYLQPLHVGSDRWVGVVAHELGHAFGHLRDEYDVFKSSGALQMKLSFAHQARINCTRGHSISFDFPPPGNVLDSKRAVCGRPGLYRSTVGSLMNGTSDKFNVVSCAHLLAVMKGGEAPEYFSVCEAKWNDAIRE